MSWVYEGSFALEVVGLEVVAYATQKGGFTRLRNQISMQLLNILVKLFRRRSMGSSGPWFQM